MNVKQRQEIERKVIRHLVTTMATHGWKVVKVNDGEEDVRVPEKTTAHAEMELILDTVFSVDESVIYFHRSFANRGMTHYAVIVLGNDGWDCVADHSCSQAHAMDDFAKLMDEKVYPYCNKLEEENYS